MKTILAGAAVILAFAGSAQAAALTATLSTPLEKPRRLIIDSTVWDCKESQCQALTSTQDTDSWQACKQLVRRAGAVSAYATLDAVKLAKCNGDVAAK